MKKISPKRSLESLAVLKKSEKDRVTLMGCKIPWNGLTANIILDFDKTSARDMSIGIHYSDGKGCAYTATKTLPLYHYRPLTIRVDFSAYSQKNLNAKEFEYYDILD